MGSTLSLITQLNTFALLPDRKSDLCSPQQQEWYQKSNRVLGDYTLMLFFYLAHRSRMSVSNGTFYEHICRMVEGVRISTTLGGFCIWWVLES